MSAAKKRKRPSPSQPGSAQALPPLPVRFAQVALLALAVAFPLVGGKLADWQTGLVGLATVAIALAVLVGRWGMARCCRLAPEDWAWIALLGLMALAVPGAVYLHAALLAVLQLLIYALSFWLARSLFREERWRQALVVALVAAGALIGVLGLREYLLTVRSSGHLSWRIFATFFNPNLVAGYLLVALPPGVVLLMRYWRRQQGDSLLSRPLSAAAVVLMLAALPLTGSKGGALGTLAAALVFGWTVAPAGSPLGRRLRRWTLALVAAGMALSLAFPPLRARLVAAFTTQSNSTAFRYYTWRGMVDMIADRPLRGFGPGSFEWAYPPYARAGFTRLGHQSYLQVATEGGLPALAAFLALWALLLQRLHRRLRASPTAGDRLLPAAALSALAGFLVHNFVDYSWYSVAVTASLLLLIGASVAQDEPPPGVAPPSRTLRGLRMAVVAGLAAIGGVLAAFYLPAQYAAAIARQELAVGRPAAAVWRAEQAVRRDPLDADNWELRATAREAEALAQRRYPAGLEAAIADRREAARLRPGDAPNWRRLALLYGEMRDPHAGLEPIARALAHNPNYVLGWAAQARLAEQAGDLALATASWQRLADLYDTPVRKYAALELPDPTYLYAWDYLARRAEQAKDGRSALDYRRKMAPLLEQVLTLPPWEAALLQSTSLLSPGERRQFALMAEQTALRLRAWGGPEDAALAERLEQAAKAKVALPEGDSAPDT